MVYTHIKMPKDTYNGSIYFLYKGSLRTGLVFIGKTEDTPSKPLEDHITYFGKDVKMRYARSHDVDKDYERLVDYLGNDVVQKPTTMPWGNRSLLFRDPDGNLVNFFTPVTPEAKMKFDVKG